MTVEDAYAAEKVMRKKLRSGKLQPMPRGRLVTGRLPMGLCVRSQCEGHLFITHRARKDEHWQSGYRQTARCIVCDYTVPAVDSSWWMELASKEHIRLCMTIVREDAEHLKQVHAYLKEKISGKD